MCERDECQHCERVTYCGMAGTGAPAGTGGGYLAETTPSIVYQTIMMGDATTAAARLSSVAAVTYAVGDSDRMAATAIF